MTNPQAQQTDGEPTERDPERAERIKSGIIYAILFAALFTAASWAVPAAYLQATPMDMHVDIEETHVVANNTTHDLTVDYTASGDYPAEVTITLYEETGDGTDKAVQSWATRGFVKQGEQTANFSLTLDSPPEAGIYYYEVRAVVHLGFNVERVASHTSDQFVMNNTTARTPTTTPGHSEESGTPTPEPTPTITEPEGTPDSGGPIGENETDVEE